MNYLIRHVVHSFCQRNDKKKAKTSSELMKFFQVGRLQVNSLAFQAVQKVSDVCFCGGCIG